LTTAAAALGDTASLQQAQASPLEQQIGGERRQPRECHGCHTCVKDATPTVVV
jgi:hypothetical protein